jgi:hypothetical protein
MVSVQGGRGRRTFVERLRERLPEKTQQAELDALGTRGQRELVNALMRAWERADSMREGNPKPAD